MCDTTKKTKPSASNEPTNPATSISNVVNTRRNAMNKSLRGQKSCKSPKTLTSIFDSTRASTPQDSTLIDSMQSEWTATPQIKKRASLTPQATTSTAPAKTIPTTNSLDQKESTKPDPSLESILTSEKPEMKGSSSAASSSSLPSPSPGENGKTNNSNCNDSDNNKNNCIQFGKWRDEELSMLKQAMIQHGRDWVKISSLIPTRTREQVKNKGSALCVHAETQERKEGNWTTEEVKMLEAELEKCGFDRNLLREITRISTRSWDQISRKAKSLISKKNEAKAEHALFRESAINMNYQMQMHNNFDKGMINRHLRNNQDFLYCPYNNPDLFNTVRHGATRATQQGAIQPGAIQPGAIQPGAIQQRGAFLHDFGGVEFGNPSSNLEEISPRSTTPSTTPSSPPSIHSIPHSTILSQPFSPHSLSLTSQPNFGFTGANSNCPPSENMLRENIWAKQQEYIPRSRNDNQSPRISVEQQLQLQLQNQQQYHLLKQREAQLYQCNQAIHWYQSQLNYQNDFQQLEHSARQMQVESLLRAQLEQSEKEKSALQSQLLLQSSPPSPSIACAENENESTEKTD